MKKSLELLNQIIEIAAHEDLINKRKNIKGKASLVVGEGRVLHHLKTLKELIILENVNSSNHRP